MDTDVAGWRLPPELTLHDVAALNEQDEFHRYELSPEGVLTVMPPATTDHAAMVSRLMFWLGESMPAEHILHGVGVRIPGPLREGGRVPDLVLLRDAPAVTVWLPGRAVHLIVEITSTGSQIIDDMIKPREYAAARVRHCWTVYPDFDRSWTITRRVLRDNVIYDRLDDLSLATLLEHSAAELLAEGWSAPA